MASYTLYTGGPYKQRDGSAITATSTDINGGSSKNIANSELLTRVENQRGNKNFPELKAGNDAGHADWSSFSAAIYTGGVSGDGALSGITNGAGNFLGLALLNETSHGFTTGVAINVRHNPTTNTGAYNGIHRVHAVINANSVVLNTKFVNTVTGIDYATSVGDYANQDAGNYSIKLVDMTVHGQANATMQSPASDYGRVKIAKVNAVRSTLVATAIRSGNYNVFTGRFSGPLTTQNDFATMDIDGTNVPDDETKALQENAPLNQGIGGEFSMRVGSSRPSGYSHGEN